MPEISDIRQSWYRSTLAGLTSADTIEGEPSAVNLESRLVRAAKPVLDSLAHQLGESNFGTLLADREGFIVQRRFGSRMLAEASDNLGVVVGAQFTEQTTGTNAISTPIEIRRGVFIRPEDHFLECLRTQTCFGLPIFQLGTRRLEGAITIMASSDESAALMKPVLTNTVQEIQQRLLNTYSEAQVALLLTFRAICESHRHMPVVAVEPNGTYSNDLAGALELRSSDYQTLRELAAGRDFNSSELVLVNLSIGEQAVAVERVSEHGTVFRIRREGEGTEGVPRISVRHRTMGDELEETLTRARASTGHILIRGEPGTGRTSTARKLGDGDRTPLIDGRSAVAMGDQNWATMLLRMAKRPIDTLIVESVNLLDARLLGVLSDAMDQTRSRIILTSNTDIESIASVASLCRSDLELPTLRQRRSEFPTILNQLLTARGAKDLRFTPAAAEALATRDWPGNLKELLLVVDEVQALCSVGDITVADLPHRYRTPVRKRNLSLLEQAEFDTIRKVLTQVRGNKAQAAQLLGISRPTLYSRIRALGLQSIG